MADYGATANSIYDPQAQSEYSVADATHGNSLADLDRADSRIDSSYAKTFKDAADARNDEAARTDFNYSQALDGNRSGLHQNDTIRQGNKYQDLVKEIGSEQASAHTDISSKKIAENNSYSALRSSIASKYAGLKSGFIADSLSKDADRAWQQQMADKTNALNLRIAQMNNATSTANTAATNKANASSGFASDLGGLEDKLRQYQATGYKGQAPSNRAQAVDLFTRLYGQYMDPNAIKQAVNQTFGRYYVG